MSQLWRGKLSQPEGVNCSQLEGWGELFTAGEGVDCHNCRAWPLSERPPRIICVSALEGKLSHLEGVTFRG